MTEANRALALPTAGGMQRAVRYALIAAAAVASGLIPYLAFSRMVLFHFYLRGSFLLDTGLLAFLVWHRDAALTQPESLGGASFFATHVTLLFLLADALSWLVPASLPQFFAGFVGISHALLALAVFWLLIEGYGMRRGAAPWGAALAGIGFAFCGLAVAIARYPHFETYIAAFFLLFATADALRRPRLAALFLALGLATREDAGFHYAAVLLLMFAAQRRKADLGFGVAALLYAVGAMAAQRLCFPDGSAFARVYLGTPALAHIDAALIGQRLLYLLVNRPYVLLPALGCTIWALRTRNPALLVGYVAALPWLLLHLLAAAPLAAALASYYAFPFLIALAWPLVAVLRQRRAAAASAGSPTGPLVAFAALLALTFVPAADLHDPGRLPLPEAFLAAPSVAVQDATDRAVAALSAARPALGRLFVDNSVAAIDPAGFTRAEVPFWSGLVPATLDTPDTIAIFADGYDAARLRALAAGGLGRHYAMPGTELHLLCRHPIDDVAALSGLIAGE